MSDPINPNIRLAIKEELEKLESKLKSEIKTVEAEAKLAIKQTRNLLGGLIVGLGLLISLLGYLKLNDVVGRSTERALNDKGLTNMLHQAFTNVEAIVSLRSSAQETMGHMKSVETDARKIVSNLNSLSAFKVVVGRIPLKEANGSGKGYRFKNADNAITVIFEPALPVAPTVLISSGDSDGKDFDNLTNYRRLTKKEMIFTVWDVGNDKNKRETKKDGEVTFFAIYQD